MMPEPLKPWAKAIVAFLVAVVAGAIAQGLINGAAAAWATVIIGALTTIGVYGVANKAPEANL